MDPLPLPLPSKEISALHMLANESKNSAGEKEYEQEILIFTIRLIYSSQHQVTTLPQSLDVII